MNIQFFNPPVWHYAGLRYKMLPTLSLPTLAAWFNQNGHYAEATDLEALEVHPKDFLVKFRAQRAKWPDVIGVTGLSIAKRGMRELMAAIREAGFTGPLIAGGVYMTVRPEDGLAWGADLVVTGECEGNILQLVESGATGIHAGQPAAIEDIPVPDWTHFRPAIATYESNIRLLLPRPGVMQMTRGCPWHCLTADTPIQLTDGRVLAIKDVQAGMTVWGADLEARRMVPQVVVAAARTNPHQYGIIKVETADGGMLTCTADHHIWTRRGWVEAGKLTIDDEVLNARTGQVCQDTSASRSTEGTGAGNAREWQIQAQETDVRRGAGDAPAAPTVTRSAGEDQGYAADARIQGASCRAGAATLCSGDFSAQDGTVGRGTQGQERAHEAQQPSTECGSAGQNQSDLTGAVGRPGSTIAGNAGCREVAAYPYDRRNAQVLERTHEARQPDEATRDCCQEGHVRALAQLCRPEGRSRAVDTGRYSAEQRRAEVTCHDRALGLSLRGERGLLDWSLQEREVSQPRLHLQERAQQDGDTTEWSLLAPAPEQERRRGTSRLCGQGLAGSYDHDNGIARANDGSDQDTGLACWTQVTSITPVTKGHAVYDLETWPNHNFFANNILVHNCTMCGNTIYGGQRTRYRPPQNVEADFLNLKSVGVLNVYVYDDELVGMKMPDGWMREVADRIAPIGLKWLTQGRCSKKYITSELMADMRRAGGHTVFWGVESFSQKVLNYMKKGTTLADIWHTLRTAREAGINNAVFTMIGNYKETDEDLAETCQALGEAYREGLIQLRQTTICTPMEGTELARVAEAEGWYKPAPDFGPQMLQHAPTPWLSVERMRYWQQKFAEACPVGLHEVPAKSMPQEAVA